MLGFACELCWFGTGGLEGLELVWVDCLLGGFVGFLWVGVGCSFKMIFRVLGVIFMVLPIIIEYMLLEFIKGINQLHSLQFEELILFVAFMKTENNLNAVNFDKRLQFSNLWINFQVGILHLSGQAKYEEFIFNKKSFSKSLK